MTPDTLPTVTAQSVVSQVGRYSAPVATITTVDPAANFGRCRLGQRTDIARYPRE
jgi:hypothetical protein